MKYLLLIQGLVRHEIKEGDTSADQKVEAHEAGILGLEEGWILSSLEGLFISNIELRQSKVQKHA